MSEETKGRTGSSMPAAQCKDSGRWSVAIGLAAVLAFVLIPSVVAGERDGLPQGVGVRAACEGLPQGHPPVPCNLPPDHPPLSLAPRLPPGHPPLVEDPSLPKLPPGHPQVNGWPRAAPVLPPYARQPEVSYFDEDASQTL